jgi:hypothetical protein
MSVPGSATPLSVNTRARTEVKARRDDEPLSVRAPLPPTPSRLRSRRGRRVRGNSLAGLPEFACVASRCQADVDAVLAIMVFWTFIACQQSSPAAREPLHYSLSYGGAASVKPCAVATPDRRWASFSL